VKERQFRFGVYGRGETLAQWRDFARKAEDLGYSTLDLPDHFSRQMAPMLALAVAGQVTSRLRFSAAMLDNDFRHPLVLAKELATLDVLSNGRVEAGIGAGWMATDYEFSGIPFDPPGVRIERLKETIAILKGLWGNEPFSFSGKHYNITNHEGTPKPAQKPHPPLLVGGGGKRVLRLAAREADIVGVNFVLAEGMVNPAVAVTGSATATAEKLAWIRAAAGARHPVSRRRATVRKIGAARKIASDCNFVFVA